MPGTVKPVGTGPGNLPVIWNAVTQLLQELQARVSALEAARGQGALLDGYGNTLELWGTNLAQQVSIGAAYQQPGVLVGTGLTGGGRAIAQDLITTTITTTKGSSAATAAAATLSNGMLIGAATVSDPSTGTATPAITPGTTISAGGGTTSLTLSQNAAESGSGLYCAACFWRLLSNFAYP